MNITDIPVTGTPAYWAAQREAVALVQAWKDTELSPEKELDLLRRIAAHGFASRMMAAHRHDVARWVAILETMRELFVDNGDEEDDDDDEVADPDRPPHGDDWCRRGCQPLFGMECGMCGYDGPGVWIDQLATVAEYCCHCNARTHQSLEGICELCGKDAETPDAPAPQPALCRRDCQPVSTDTRRTPCRHLERNAPGGSCEARHPGQAAPGHGAPKATILDGGR